MHDMNMQKFTCFLMFFSNYSLKNPGKTINTTKTVKKKNRDQFLMYWLSTGHVTQPLLRGSAIYIDSKVLLSSYAINI